MGPVEAGRDFLVDRGILQEIRLAGVFIRPMAVEAVLREDRANVPVEDDLLPGPRREQAGQELGGHEELVHRGGVRAWLGGPFPKLTNLTAPLREDEMAPRTRARTTRKIRVNVNIASRPADPTEIEGPPIEENPGSTQWLAPRRDLI